jgi:hypothetical protein
VCGANCTTHMIGRGGAERERRSRKGFPSHVLRAQTPCGSHTTPRSTYLHLLRLGCSWAVVLRHGVGAPSSRRRNQFLQQGNRHLHRGSNGTHRILRSGSCGLSCWALRLPSVCAAQGAWCCIAGGHRDRLVGKSVPSGRWSIWSTKSVVLRLGRGRLWKNDVCHVSKHCVEDSQSLSSSGKPHRVQLSTRLRRT